MEVNAYQSGFIVVWMLISCLSHLTALLLNAAFKRAHGSPGVGQGEIKKVLVEVKGYDVHTSKGLCAVDVC